MKLLNAVGGARNSLCMMGDRPNGQRERERESLDGEGSGFAEFAADFAVDSSSVRRGRGGPRWQTWMAGEQYSE